MTVPGIGAPTSFLFPLVAFGWMCNSWKNFNEIHENRFETQKLEFFYIQLTLVASLS